MGNALAALARNDEAIAIFREVIAKMPGMAYAHSNLGVILQERGQVDAAIACYERALAIQPDHHDALNNVGYLLQETGRRREAMELYGRALAANPGYARAEYNLALAHLAEREFGPGWKLHDARYRTVPPVTVPRQYPIPAFTAADLGPGPHARGMARAGRRRPAAVFDAPSGPRAACEGIRARSRRAPRARLQARASGVECGLAGRVRRGIRALRPSCADGSAGGPAAAHARELREPAEGAPRRRFRARPRLSRAARRAGRAHRGHLVAQLPALGARLRAAQEIRVAGSVRCAFAPRESPPCSTSSTATRQRSARRSRRPAGQLARLDGLDLFNDLDGVLAAIAACDLVVTTSNVTAHLAGALGKATLLVYLSREPALPLLGDGRERGGCLWYPSVRDRQRAGRGDLGKGARGEGEIGARS